MIVIGIDPGKNGAIVCLDSVARSPVRMTKMPEHERDILDWLAQLGTNWRVDDVFLEWIHPAIQGVGKASMSKLYGSYMRLRMAVIALHFPLEEARAAKWQQGLGISKRDKSETDTQWKNRLKARAVELYPHVNVTLWNCDALLIATYGARLRSGELPSPPAAKGKECDER